MQERLNTKRKFEDTGADEGTAKRICFEKEPPVEANIVDLDRDPLFLVSHRKIPS